jgi:hypothetical protein
MPDKKIEGKDKISSVNFSPFYLLGEASKLSVIIVLVPVLVLLASVGLGKKFGAMPVFVGIGVFLGIVFFAFYAKEVSKRILRKV